MDRVRVIFNYGPDPKVYREVSQVEVNLEAGMLVITHYVEGKRGEGRHELDGIAKVEVI